MARDSPPWPLRCSKAGRDDSRTTSGVPPCEENIAARMPASTAWIASLSGIVVAVGPLGGMLRHLVRGRPWLVVLAVLASCWWSWAFALVSLLFGWMVHGRWSSSDDAMLLAFTCFLSVVQTFSRFASYHAFEWGGVLVAADSADRKHSHPVRGSTVGGAVAGVGFGLARSLLFTVAPAFQVGFDGGDFRSDHYCSRFSRFFVMGVDCLFLGVWDMVVTAAVYRIQSKAAISMRRASSARRRPLEWSAVGLLAISLCLAADLAVNLIPAAVAIRTSRLPFYCGVPWVAYFGIDLAAALGLQVWLTRPRTAANQDGGLELLDSVDTEPLNAEPPHPTG